MEFDLNEFQTVPRTSNRKRWTAISRSLVIEQVFICLFVVFVATLFNMHECRPSMHPEGGAHQFYTRFGLVIIRYRHTVRYRFILASMQYAQHARGSRCGCRCSDCLVLSIVHKVISYLGLL